MGKIEKIYYNMLIYNRLFTPPHNCSQVNVAESVLSGQHNCPASIWRMPMEVGLFLSI